MAACVFFPLIANFHPEDNTKYTLGLQDGTYKLTDEVFMPVWNQFADWAKNKVIAPESEATSYNNSLINFAQEKNAMLIAYDASFASIQSGNPDLNFGYFLLPARGVEERYAPILQAQMNTVNINSKYISEALKYFEFISTPEIAKLFSDTTNMIPTVKNVDLGSPVLKGFYEMLGNHPTTPNPQDALIYSEMWNLIGGASAAIMSGDSVDEVLTKSQAELDALVESKAE